MQYLITFLEGFISFISPCMLPMLPLYISYFAGGADQKQRTLLRSVSFVLGFTVVFTLLGVFSGAVGRFLARYDNIVNIVCGAVVVLFGLSYLEIIPLRFLRGVQHRQEITGVFSAFLFGVIYSVSLTPCVGAFLGSALMLASTSGSVAVGALLLLCYSLGLGIPFLLSAVLIDKLRGAFSFIKRNYRIINLICGIFLIVIGILMMLGMMNAFLSLFT
ncbi:MAG: cytochrome c biogenesis protein CcdA [Ruminococcaceae bacterium]|nr:cytochrome c biogenesis protein CcdA [Oscillospiraceae bacterium]